MTKHIGKKIKVVFFDHDDTLVSTFKAKSAHHKHVALKYYGKHLSDEEIMQHWGLPLQKLVCVLYGTNNVAEAMANNKSCHQDFPKKLFVYSIPALRHINKAGKLIGIITATSRFSFEHDLISHKLPKEIIGYTQTEDDTSYHKPDPRVFEPALAWLAKQQIKPNEVLYVGDSLHDMKAAKGAGFTFLGVETGLVSADQFREADTKSIRSIADLTV